jgi:hypothetical protein
MPKNLSNSVKVQILIGVAVAVLSAAAIKIWNDHDSRLTEMADLKARVNTIEKQLDDVYRYGFDIERPKK